MATSLDYGELQDTVKRILARDSRRLANTNYSAYPGKTISPMSSLTQKAQELEARRAQKGIPYASSLNALVDKPNQGMSPDNIQSLLTGLQTKHDDFNANITGKRLNKQFQSGFLPYQDKYNSRFNKDRNLRLADSKLDLEQLNDKFKDLEQNSNDAAFKAVTNSSMGKKNREENLIGMQKEFGSQKHGVNNIGLTAEKARFEAEKRDPYERLSNLQQALSGTDMEEDHPDLLANNAKQLEKALLAYGVDTSLPHNQWGKTPSLHTPTYGGKLAEPINAEMGTSYKLAESLSPSYRDRNYGERKNIRKELVNEPNNIDSFINRDLPGKLTPRYNLINEEAKQKAKADMTALNAKYIKQGTYGGQSHIKSAAARMQELNSAAYGTTAKTLNNELVSGVAGKHSNTLNKISKLDQYDKQANSEFGNMLDDIKRTNTTGIEKWKNDQTGNEQLYKAYQNEKGYQQPRLLGNARAAGADMGINGMIGSFAKQGIDLSLFSDLQNRYSNLEKELSTANTQIRTQNDYNRQRQLIADQEARLAAERTRQAQADAANRQRLEDERKRQVEQARQAQQVQARQAQQVQANSGPTPQLQALMNKWKAYPSYMTLGNAIGKPNSGLVSQGPSRFVSNAEHQTIQQKQAAEIAEFEQHMNTLRNAGYYPKYYIGDTDTPFMAQTHSGKYPDYLRIKQFSKYNGGKWDSMSDPSKFTYY